MNHILFLTAVIVYALVTGRTYPMMFCYLLAILEYLDQIRWFLGLRGSPLQAIKITYQRIALSVYTTIVFPIILFAICQPSHDRTTLFASSLYLPLLGTDLLIDFGLILFFLRRRDFLSFACNQTLFKTPTASEIVAAHDCAICTSDLLLQPSHRYEQVVKIPCMHLFHRVCIDLCFFQAVSCPSCNKDFMQQPAYQPYENSNHYGSLDSWI